MQQLVQRVQQLLLRVPEKLAFFLVIAVPTIALMTYFVLSDTERLDTPTASDPTAQRAVLSPTSAPPAAAVRATPMPTRGEATASPRLASGSLAPAASATAGGALASDLYTRLRSSSLSTGELPPGFTLPVLRTSTTLADTLAPGQPLVGAVEISVHGPDARDLVAYLVFASPTAAAAAFAAPRVGEDERNPLVFVPYGLAEPVQCRSAGVSDSVGDRLGVTACYLQHGPVLVIGLSALSDSSGERQHGTPDSAIALVAAGVRHLDSLSR